MYYRPAVTRVMEMSNELCLRLVSGEPFYKARYLFDVDELDLLRFSLELVALLFARLVDDEVGLRRLPVEAPNAREGVDRGAEDLVSVE